MNNIELETKYELKINKLTEFTNLLISLNKFRINTVSGTDTFYAVDDKRFIRIREDSENTVLTVKMKINDNNNIMRHEVNLNTSGDIRKFLEILGYEKVLELFKTSIIFSNEDVDIVYYMASSDRSTWRDFIEIEVINPDREDAFQILEEYERLLSPLGITKKNRKRLSLYEIYKSN